MATVPTNKPIPSEDPRDLKFNAGKIDEVVTSDAHYYTDRFGVRRWTIAGFQYTAEDAIRNYGYITMDSFEDGATLTLPNQVLRYEATGEYYRWDGEFPKTIPSGSTPETSGGVGLGAWVSVGDASLRTDISSDYGVPVISPHKVKAIPEGTLADTQCYATPEQFGAVGDGVTDDTQAMRDALTAISTGKIRWLRGIAGSTYLTAQLEIPVGVKKISELNLVFTTSQGVGLYSQGADKAHADLEISDCSINANALLRGGILLGNATRCRILRNRVYGFAADGSERYGIRIGTVDTSIINSYNTISDNNVTMPVDPDNGGGTAGMAGIYLVAPNNFNSDGSVNWGAQYNTIQYLTVTNNTCTGGTHNVMASGMLNAEFAGNILIGGSHRNINLGSGCQRVVMTNNRLINAESAAIIFGEARYMRISDNYIQSAVSSAHHSDDAAIQFAQGANNVDVVNNLILGDWKYGIHIFNARYVNIKGNSITASTVGIAVESSQSLTLPSDALYSERRIVTELVTGATTEYDISGNAYTLTGSNACAIYLCQFNNVVLGNISINNETVYSVGNARHILYICNANSLATNIQISNVSARGANGSKYYSTLGRTPFSRVSNVSGLEDIAIEVSVAAGTPSALLGPSLYVASGTVTNFTNGINGQVLQVRLAIGASLAHNNSLIRLKGDTNVTSNTGNSIVTLTRRNNIWFETARSF